MNGQNLPSLIIGYLDFCFSFFLKQFILVPIRVTSRTATLICSILTGSSQNVSQYCVIKLGISAHDLVYCTKKTSSLKLNKPSEMSLNSMKIMQKKNL